MWSFKAVVALATVATGIAFGSFASTASASVVVPSTADIFLAGQTLVPANVNSGYAADAGTNYNPGASGLGLGSLPISFDVVGGETITLTASGTVSCCLGGQPTNGPNGGGLNPGGSANIAGLFNVGAITTLPELALLGVWGGPTLTTPWAAFLVGTADTITAPIGATNLYLGTDDAYGFADPPGWYNDNTGSFTVSVVNDASGIGVSPTPLPSTWTMLIAGLVGIGFFAHRGSRKNATALAAA